MTAYLQQYYVYGFDRERPQRAFGVALGTTFVSKDTGREYRAIIGSFWSLPASSGDPSFKAIAGSVANVDVASAPAALDGVALTKGDVILLKDQTDNLENGLYVFSAAAEPLVRQAQWTGVSAIAPGYRVVVDLGTTNESTEWAVSSDTDLITFGTSDCHFCRAQGHLLFGSGTFNGGGTAVVFAPIKNNSVVMLTDSTATPNPTSAALADRTPGLSFIANGTAAATFDWQITLPR